MTTQPQTEAARARARAAWALLTAEPRLTLEDLAELLRCSRSGAWNAVQRLKVAGYIDEPARGARRVLIPLYAQLSKPKRS